MSFEYAESHVEEAALAYLADLGYAIVSGPEIAPDSAHSERLSYADIILEMRLRRAVERLNPSLPASAHDDAVRQVLQSAYAEPVAENRRIHSLITNGLSVEYRNGLGEIVGDTVRFIDVSTIDANDWLAVNQFTVIGSSERRPDVVIFVNGLPIGVIELKNPLEETATLEKAFNQLQTYRQQIPALFRTNETLVTSDGIGARVGSLTADRERFMRWRTIDGETEAPSGIPELEVLIQGLFERRRLLRFVQDFIVFAETGDDLFKIIAGYHQYHAALKGLEATLRATSTDGDRKVGVIWHTQGTGKSLLMAFYCRAAGAASPRRCANPTIVVVTDRNDLDDQLFATFSMCADLLRQDADPDRRAATTCAAGWTGPPAA